MASIDPLLLVLMDCLTEAVSSTNFGLHVWSHSRFKFLPRFCFPDLYCCSRVQNVIETRHIHFVLEIIHF